MIDLTKTTPVELANALYDYSGELMASPELVLFTLNNSTRDMSQADGPMNQLANILLNMRKDLKWSDLEFATAVMTALKNAIEGGE